MVELLTTNGSSLAIEELIKRSENRLYLISPYLKINPLIKPLLQQVDNRDSPIDIRIVTKTDKLNTEDIAFLKSLINTNVYILNNLHAKIYINQDTAIITSLNLHQYSQNNNIEMGVKIDFNRDPELFVSVFREAVFILMQSKYHPAIYYDYTYKEPSKIPLINGIMEDLKLNNKQSGHCIKCGVTVELNPSRPLCSSCYQKMAGKIDFTHKEEYCHCCGKKSKQSYSKPLCINCYKNMMNLLR